jgi:hypothetical protein
MAKKKKDRAPRRPLNTEDERGCYGCVNTFTSGNRRVTLVINTGISHEWGKDREMLLKTSGTYPW